MNTIVVPTDLGPETDVALSVAVALARTNRSRILLLHSVVYPMPVSAFVDATRVAANLTVAECQEIEREARTKLDQFAANSQHQGVTIVPTLLTNGQGLIHHVTDAPADLIVMTSEGASGLEE
ncbi:universal stress protein [Spirosoma endophyticum]|uniref:Nucleotide-binding universal stress protein, UspA family n=1 Tax=Spirosoma endophyticum TaxID=662367 RepID=A0A1I1HQ16_9BACT|nr:universal stress protein [Spirosoma endophyticum]SFC24058.1 Nucleotide-binding universal stress protein, UspA family [Spirosoma endophyticum]